jgi:hypothetical protein
VLVVRINQRQVSETGERPGSPGQLSDADQGKVQIVFRIGDEDLRIEAESRDRGRLSGAIHLVTEFDEHVGGGFRRRYDMAVGQEHARGDEESGPFRRAVAEYDPGDGARGVGGKLEKPAQRHEVDGLALKAFRLRCLHRA